MKLLSAIVYLTSATSLVFSAPLPNLQTQATDASPVPTRLVATLNEHRRHFGLSALHIDPLAERAAQLQAEDMQAHDVLRHLDSSGRSPMERFTQLGGHAAAYGENVAYYSEPSSDAGKQWVAVAKLDDLMMAEKPPEDGHRQNILSPMYDGVGVGIAIGPHGIFIAEDFVAVQDTQ